MIINFFIRSFNRRLFSHVRDYNNNNPPPTTPAIAAPTTANIPPCVPTAASVFPPPAEPLGVGEPLGEPLGVGLEEPGVLVEDKLKVGEGVLLPPTGVDEPKEEGIDVWIVTTEDAGWLSEHDIVVKLTLLTSNHATL